MKKLHKLLDIILLERYIKSQLQEQTVKLPGAGGLKVRSPRIPYEEPIIPGTNKTRSSTYPNFEVEIPMRPFSFPDAQTKINSDIESIWSLKQDPKTVIQTVAEKNSDLYSAYPELINFTVDRLKEKTGQTEVKPELVPEPYTPPELPAQKPVTAEPPVLEIEPSPEPSAKPMYPEMETKSMLSPDLAALFATALATQTGMDQQQQYSTQPQLKQKDIVKKYTTQSEMRPRGAKDENTPDFEFEGSPEQIKISEPQSSAFAKDVDADLTLDKILGKYSSTLRLK